MGMPNIYEHFFFIFRVKEENEGKKGNLDNQ